MTEFLLIRHAVNDFVTTGRLAGWTPEVHLNTHGRAQAAALAARLATTRIDALYSSPLERTVETAEALLEHHPNLEMQLLEDIGEVGYGRWQGAELGKLAGRKLWRTVQLFPSRARFPEGETMREAQMRAVNAIELLYERHPRGRVAVVSHSDVIKMIVAYYLGLHLDMFQRIEISPASLTIIRLGGWGRPIVVQVNETSYLPEPPEPAVDEREIGEIRPVGTIVLDAIGEPGNRTFYLQVTGDEQPPGEPVTFVLEKTQALMLADEVDKLLIGEAAGPPPALHRPERVMFRVGKFTLQYEDDLVRLELEEMLGDRQGTPRTLRLWATPQQVKTLGDHARRVAQGGRSSMHNASTSH